MKLNRIIITIYLIALSIACPALNVMAQTIVFDEQKEKQLKSMEAGPWDFSPDWYYYFLHKNYSGAESYWQWAGLKSGLRVRFKEEKSNVGRVLPVREAQVLEQTTRLSKTTKELEYVEEMFKDDVAKQADRTIDSAYLLYKDDFNRMQDVIAEGLLICQSKSKGDMNRQIDELMRQNEVLCEYIAYIHKTGVGYDLENATRQKAYEEAKESMTKLMRRTSNLAALAVSLYQ